MYAVLVATTVGTWTTHSTHAKKSEAQDQADMVRGRVVRADEDGDVDADQDSALDSESSSTADCE